jgi:hypothetical protein
MRAVAQAQADGADIVDIIAPNIEEDQRLPVTPKDAGWTENRAPIDAAVPAAVRPVIQLPENYGRPGFTGLIIFLGALFLLAGGAVLLYMRNNRYADDEE